jgi:CubicO group peptidase (beta-lactamase class C family)
MAAGIVVGDRVIWTKGFGQADVARGVPATDTTVFHLASLTKTFASIVVLDLVDKGKLSLEDPVANYGVPFPDVRVWHLLSHTSEGVPGTAYRYNGNRFGALDQVIERAAGRSFLELVVEKVIRPVGLEHTGPGTMKLAASAGLDTTKLRGALATGYDGATNRVNYPTYVGTAAGLTSSVSDMLAYSRALDEDRLLPPQMKERAFTAIVTSNGDTLPYGLGWFVTRFGGHKVVWHYGLWTGNSSLIVKVPDQGATFLLLANSDRLSQPFSLGTGRLESSPFARAFLEWLLGGS